MGTPARRVTTPHHFHGVRVAEHAVTLAVLLVLALLPFFTNDFTILNQVSHVAIFGIAALGLNLVLGSAGQYWLGQSAIFAAGAYISGIAATRWDVPFWGAVPMAMSAGVLIAVIAGLPGLRLAGFYLAMATFYLAALVPRVAEYFSDYTGGHNGLIGIPRPSLLGLTFKTEHMYGLTVFLAVVTFFAIRSLLGSHWGRTFKLVAAGEQAAGSMGVRVWAVKLRAYMVGGLLVSLAGALYAHTDRFVTPGAMGFDLTVFLLAAVVIGGSSTLVGPIVGVAVLRALPEIVSGFDKYSLMVYGLLLLGVMIFAPAGIVPTIRRLSLRAWDGAWGLSGHILSRGNPTGSAPTSGSHPPADAPSAVPSFHAVKTDSREPVLAVHQVSKRFGGLLALDGVDVEVRPGSLCAVIGPNGSGKTTLINVISGMHRPDTGSVLLQGRRTERAAAHVIAGMGVRRTFQTPFVIPELTVLDNVLLGLGMPKTSLLAASLAWPTSRRLENDSLQRAGEILAFVGLADLRGVPAGSLSSGQQRLLEFARALLPEPRLLLLDEPTVGLSPSETVIMTAVLRSLVASGVAVLMVEHNMSFVMENAETIFVLDQGSIVAAGSPDEIQKDESVVRAYIGGGGG
jgi:branched-chain amino acid transport system permease protein